MSCEKCSNYHYREIPMVDYPIPRMKHIKIDNAKITQIILVIFSVLFISIIFFFIQGCLSYAHRNRQSNYVSIEQERINVVEQRQQRVSNWFQRNFEANAYRINTLTCTEESFEEDRNYYFCGIFNQVGISERFYCNNNGNCFQR